MTRVQAAWQLLREDLNAALDRDPAARGVLEVALAYPGVHALWAHRLTHRMWNHPGLRLPARLISQATRSATGIEIHPQRRSVDACSSTTAWGSSSGRRPSSVTT